MHGVDGHKKKGTREQKQKRGGKKRVVIETSCQNDLRKDSLEDTEEY